ncbi:MAG: hypothetical protein QXD78_01090 [Candidatus Bathyarchaeia archaeon]
MKKDFPIVSLIYLLITVHTIVLYAWISAFIDWQSKALQDSLQIFVENVEFFKNKANGMHEEGINITIINMGNNTAKIVGVYIYDNVYRQTFFGSLKYIPPWILSLQQNVVINIPAHNTKTITITREWKPDTLYQFRIIADNGYTIDFIKASPKI